MPATRLELLCIHILGIHDTQTSILVKSSACLYRIYSVMHSNNNYYCEPLTFAAAGWTGSTGCVASAAFKEAGIVGLNVGLTTIPGSAMKSDSTSDLHDSNGLVSILLSCVTCDAWHVITLICMHILILSELMPAINVYSHVQWLNVRDALPANIILISIIFILPSATVPSK